MNYNPLVRNIIYATNLVVFALSNPCYAENKKEPEYSTIKNEKRDHYKRCIILKEMIPVIAENESKIKKGLNKIVNEECGDLPLTKREKQILSELEAALR